MPTANNQGIRIHYEVEGQGPPLVLQHGLTADLESWRSIGYVEALKNDYRLILIDARGHGASDKPHAPEAYKAALMAGDVVAVLDELNIHKAHYCGYSMGGGIGWGIARYAPERFRSLIIGGMSPYHNMPPEGFNFVALFQQGMPAVLAAFEVVWGPRWTSNLKAKVSANDLEALIAVCLGDEDPGIKDLLPTITLPCLLFGGEKDDVFGGAQECARRMPNATLVSLPGLDHIEALYRLDLVVPHIRKFLTKVG